MKNSLHTNPIMFKMVLLVTCFMLVMIYNKSKAANLTASVKQQPLTVAMR